MSRALPPREVQLVLSLKATIFTYGEIKSRPYHTALAPCGLVMIWREIHRA
jgi:hypothetical protein